MRDGLHLNIPASQVRTPVSISLPREENLWAERKSGVDGLPHHTPRRLPMQLLHLDSSILGVASVSRRLSARIVARHQALHPSLRVVVRDLAADPALHLSGAHMAAFQGAP